jgi:hypothetical protein
MSGFTAGPKCYASSKTNNPPPQRDHATIQPGADPMGNKKQTVIQTNTLLMLYRQMGARKFTAAKDRLGLAGKTALLNRDEAGRLIRELRGGRR